MTQPTAARRQAWTALVTLAALVLLLVAGIVWSWRAAGLIAAPSQQPAAGPLSKVAHWVEPPLRNNLYDLSIAIHNISGIVPELAASQDDSRFSQDIEYTSAQPPWLLTSGSSQSLVPNP